MVLGAWPHTHTHQLTLGRFDLFDARDSNRTCGSLRLVRLGVTGADHNVLEHFTGGGGKASFPALIHTLSNRVAECLFFFTFPAPPLRVASHCEHAKGGRKSQYPIYGRTTGRIAALLFACVARHTALRAPCTASRQRTQKRYIGYFRLPNDRVTPRLHQACKHTCARCLRRAG